MDQIWRRQFLVASETEASFGAPSVPHDGKHAIEVDAECLYGLANAELGELQCLLMGKQEYDDKVLHGYKEVYEWDNMHGPWLIRLPGEFREVLASCEDTAIAELAKKWREKTYAFRENNAPEEWVEETLRQLVGIARLATEERKNLYWQPGSC